MSTANLLLPEISSSQTAKELTHNAALHVLDALVDCAIIDRDLTAPPGSPTDGDLFIPKATATGAFAGKENQLAQWDVNAWKFHVPEEGWICYVRDEDSLLVYTGSAWTVLARPVSQSIAYAATITPNFALGERVIVGALTGNLTINAPTNPQTGGMLCFSFAQDATGSRTITWNAAFKKAADGAGTASKKGATSFLYDGAAWVQIGAALAWA